MRCLSSVNHRLPASRISFADRCTELFDWLNLDQLESVKRSRTMSVARVTEISSSSTTSFEDAIKTGISRASKTIRQVEGAWIKEQKVVVKDGAISEYRVSMQVTFVLDD